MTTPGLALSQEDALTTDAICGLAAAGEIPSSEQRLYMAFVDQEKAFVRVPGKVILWALRKLGVEE